MLFLTNTTGGMGQIIKNVHLFIYSSYIFLTCSLAIASVKLTGKCLNIIWRGISLRSLLYFSTVAIISNHKTLSCLTISLLLLHSLTQRRWAHKMLITVQTDSVDILRMPVPPWHLPRKQMLFASVCYDNHWWWQEMKNLHFKTICSNIQEHTWLVKALFKSCYKRWDL